MRPRSIAPNVYWVGVNDYVKELFESLWPIPFGISYNAYVVIGRDGIALIDTVDERFSYDYMGRVREVVGDLNRVRYIVLHHLEPDHHGATPYVLEQIKDAKLVVTPIASKIIKSLYRIPDNRILTVEDGHSLDLGGKTLKFVYTPWLHWPETMMTYLEEDGILFSCDAFGSYGALEDGLFDDEVDMDFYTDEAKRYFSNIVSKYAKNVLDALEKLKGLNIRMIAPSHGPIYRSNVSHILELYRKWSLPEPDKDSVVVVYASMYGRGEEIVDMIIDGLGKAGLSVNMYNVSIDHPSYILSDIVDSYILVVVYPSYDAGLFPYMENLLYILQLKQLGRGRHAALINTFSWAPTSRLALELLQKAGFNIIEPVVETKSIPDEEALSRINSLVKNIVSLAGR